MAGEGWGVGVELGHLAHQFALARMMRLLLSSVGEWVGGWGVSVVCWGKRLRWSARQRSSGGQAAGKGLSESWPRRQEGRSAD